MRIQVGQFNS